MASHKEAGAGVTITSTLGAAELAELCKSAADQSTGKAVGPGQQVRLEEASTGQLRFSVRARGGRKEFLIFDVKLTDSGDRRQMTTTIRSYKTRQQQFLHIPMGPKRMLGLETYKQFIDGFRRQVLGADPAATCSVR